MVDPIIAEHSRARECLLLTHSLSLTLQQSINLLQVSWIDDVKLVQFILQCQDAEVGGISDRPTNMADIFHTFFGISGLSLLGFFVRPLLFPDANGDDLPVPDDEYASFREIDPTYALPKDIVERLSLPRQTLPSVGP